MSRFVMGLGLVMGTVLAAACGRGPDFGPINEVASIAAQCRTNLSGDLTRNGIPLGRIRSQAGALEGAGDWVTHASGRIAIQPICESHLKDRPALRRGEFVARIMIMDTATAYSTQRTDVVYLWVFERNGQLTSQLVSMTDADKATAIKTVPFRECEETPYDTERAGWHPDACQPGGMAAAEASTLLRDNPWFGCRLGCCYAVMPQS